MLHNLWVINERKARLEFTEEFAEHFNWISSPSFTTK